MFYLRTHHFASSQTIFRPHRPPLPGLVACTAKKASYASGHCLEKTRTRWNDFLFLITDDRDFRPQTCTNGLVFRECKHIKNIFEYVYFTKNSFHITLICNIYQPEQI